MRVTAGSGMRRRWKGRWRTLGEPGRYRPYVLEKWKNEGGEGDEMGRTLPVVVTRGFSSINDSLTRRESMNESRALTQSPPFMLSFAVVGLLTVRVLTHFVDDIRRLPC